MRLAWVVALAIVAGGCQREATPASVAREAAPVPKPKVLAEVVNQSAALTVQVVDAQRVTPDTVRIEIALINTSRAPEPLDVVQALTGGGQAADAAGAAGAAKLTPADLCLVTPDGSRRLFVLRDAATNAPQAGGGFEPLQPGERRLVWAVFPSPSPDTPRVNLLLAGLVLRDVPISPAPSETRAS